MKGSRALTVHNVNVDDVHARLSFLFEELAKTSDSIQITHYKKIREGTNNESTTNR